MNRQERHHRYQQQQQQQQQQQRWQRQLAVRHVLLPLVRPLLFFGLLDSVCLEKGPDCSNPRGLKPPAVAVWVPISAASGGVFARATSIVIVAAATSARGAPARARPMINVMINVLRLVKVVAEHGSGKHQQKEAGHDHRDTQSAAAHSARGDHSKPAFTAGPLRGGVVLGVRRRATNGQLPKAQTAQLPCFPSGILYSIVSATLTGC